MKDQAEKKWNSLTDQQKMSFGWRWITHESNISAWCKEYSELSELKKKRVLSSISVHLSCSPLYRY